MPYDKKEDNPYISGVPVKISEKFKRPPKIHLSGQNSCLNPLSSREYDFILERSVLSKMEEWKRAKDEEIFKREERLQAWNKLDPKPSPQSSNDVAPDDSNIATNMPPKISVVNSTPSNILTPVFANHPSLPQPMPYAKDFNLSDFESDNSSPFDNMELKTINDMEVLASVLSTTPAKSEAANKIGNSINNNTITNKNGYSWDYNNMYSRHNYYAPSVNYETAYGSPTYQAMHPQVYSQWQPENVSTFSYVPLASDPSYSESRTFHASPPDQSHMQSKSNSKSVPDLVLELEKELKDKREWEEQRRKTKTPPPRPNLQTGFENWKPWPDLESPRHSGPDSIESLSTGQQSLARNFSDMGFPLMRVVRTIRKFQGDDKKVIEFLLQVQRLEERNFTGDAVEKALHANNYDENEAVKHLNAAIVLLDLGFEADKVERVLIDCKNDRDSALDKLIS